MNNGDTMLHNFHIPATPADQGNPTILHTDIKKGNLSEISEVINHVFNALKEKGYEPVTQFVQYLLSGDPTYITSYNNARVMISSLERDDIIEELLKAYLKQNNIAI